MKVRNYKNMKKMKKGTIVFNGVDLKRSKELITVKKDKYKEFIEQLLKSVKIRKSVTKNTEKNLNNIKTLDLQDDFLEKEYETLLSIFRGEVMDSKNKEVFNHPVYFSFSYDDNKDWEPIDERLANIDKEITNTIRHINIKINKLRRLNCLYKTHYELFLQLCLETRLLKTTKNNEKNNYI